MRFRRQTVPPFLHRTEKIVNLLLAAAKIILWFIITKSQCRHSDNTVACSGKLLLWKHLSWAAGALLLHSAVPRSDSQCRVCHTYGIPADDRRNRISQQSGCGSKTGRILSKSSDPGFYRIGNLTPREQNDSMQFAYNGITHYSSEDSLDVRRFLRRLGFDYNGLYSSYGSSNTRTADSILGVKYVLSPIKSGKMKRHSRSPWDCRLSVPM
jgi:hypothetical protein